MKDDNNPVISPRPAILGALIAGSCYILLTLLITRFGLDKFMVMVVGVHLGLIIIAVVHAQVAMRRSLGTDTNMEGLWRYGGIAALLFALILALYHSIYISTTGAGANILQFFALYLIFNSILGLVISAIVAFFISKTKT